MNLFRFLFLALIVSQSLTAQTLRQKIGQMVMVGFSGTTTIPDSLKKDLKERNIGGVILFAANITSPSQIKALTDTIRKYSATPPFIAVDQEGGRVARFSRANGFDTSYSAYTLGTTINSDDTTKKMAATMAGWLKISGFNVNFAPVADVDVNPTSPAIGAMDRSFSKYPEAVAHHALLFSNEFRSKGIISALKHFPGHGSAVADSHNGFTDISTTWADSELTPYRRMLASGYNDMVMVGHLFNNKIDTSYPASLSAKAVNGLLRAQLGYNGVVVTDGMSMQAITNTYSFDSANVLAAGAGVDLLLYTTNIRSTYSLARQIIDRLELRVNQGLLPLARINESYNRIMDLKTRYGIVTGTNRLSGDIPSDFGLSNFPNPFNPSTAIVYHVTVREVNAEGSVRVSLKVYDVLGRAVCTLADEEQTPGTYRVQFSAAGLSSGIYFCVLQAGVQRKAIKMNLLK